MYFRTAGVDLVEVATFLSIFLLKEGVPPSLLSSFLIDCSGMSSFGA